MDGIEAGKEGKPFLIAGVTVIVIIALFIVLFWFAPKEGVGAGKAILTTQQAQVVEDSGTLFSSGFLNNQYTLLKHFVREPNPICPMGSNPILDTSGALSYCSTAGTNHFGWVIVKLNTPTLLRDITLTLANRNENNPTPGTNDATSVDILTSVNYDGVAPPNWVFKRRVTLSSPTLALSVTVPITEQQPIKAILIARGGQGNGFPDPRLNSIDLGTYQCNSVNGQIVTVNNLVGVCQNGVLSTDLSCSQLGLTQANAYCNGQQWITTCTPIHSTEFLSSGSGLQRDGCCQNGNSCVGGTPGGSQQCYTDGSVIGQYFCSNKDWYECDVSPNDGQVRGNFICQRGVWVAQQCSPGIKGLVQGNTYCDGNRWQPLQTCDPAADGMLVPAQNPIVFCDKNSGWQTLAACTQNQKGEFFLSTGTTTSNPSANARLVCDGTAWQVLPRGQNGIIAPAQGVPLAYFQNSLWNSLVSSTNLCDSTTNKGKSLVGKLYCEGSQWSTSCSVPNTPVSVGGVVVGTTTDPAACCPSSSCYSNVDRGGSLLPGYKGNSICLVENQIDSSHGGISWLCSGASLYECRPSNAFFGTKTEGTFTPDKSKYCNNGQWQTVTQGCTVNNANSVLGQAYCNGQQYVPCGDVAGLLCIQEQLNQPSTSYMCDTQNIGTVKAGTEGSFYCSSQRTWLKCEQSTVGKIQDEAFVCADAGASATRRYLWAPVNCQACLAGNPGKCIGSPTVDVTTGRSRVGQQDEYYADTTLVSVQGVPGLNTQIATKIGCVDDVVPQCTRNGNAYYVDQSYVSGTIDRTNNPLCGNNNRWQICPQNFAGYVASDGGEYLCGNSGWEQCSSTMQGQQRGGFTCTNINNKWQWFSQFACSPSGKYKLRTGTGTTGNTLMCDGSQWRDCTYFDTNPILDYNVNFQCQHPSRAVNAQSRTMILTETACNNNLDDDNDGVADCADRDCFEALGLANSFTVTLKRYGCLLAAVDSESTGGLADFQNIHLCDQGTERLASVATLCATGGSALSLTSGKVQVQSMTSLKTAAVKPFTYASDKSITFLYFEPTSGLKEVHASFTIDITTVSQSFPLSNFVPNMATGQKLVLKQGNELYMLSFPSNATLFSFDQLQVMRLPTMQTYPAQQYAGTNDYIFYVENQQTIVVGVDPANGQVSITSRDIGTQLPEIAAGYATPYNLLNQLEVPFTQSTPVTITNPSEVGDITICRNDNPADVTQVLVCRTQAPAQFSLRLGNLISIRIGQNDYAFLYELKNNQKTISVYQIQHSTTPPAQGSLIYNEFINAMVQGRRVAFELIDEQGDSNLYLAEHPVQATFSLQDVKLKQYTTAGMTTFPASGSVDRVEFMVLEGRITVQRNYGVPPPPFDLIGETRRQIADMPLNLENRTFTSFSSEVPVRIDAPTNYGIISAAPNDIALFQPTFRVQRTAPSVRTFDLPYRVPIVDAQPASSAIPGPRNTLFYYHTAEINGVVPIKTASVYRLYELPTAGTPLFHIFDNNFITSFTQGNELALKFESSLEDQAQNYYLLGYQGADPTVQFFDINKVTLKSLKDAASYSKTISGQQALFSVPEGTVNVTIVTDQLGVDKIKFSTIAQIQAATTQLARDYAYTLGVTDQVLIGFPNPQLFNMCNVNIYNAVTAANVCYGQGTAAQTIIVNGVTTFKASDGSIFLLETNGRTGANKKVIIRKMINLNDVTPTFDFLGNLNWTWFANHVVSGDVPVFNITGTYYLPLTQSSLLQDLQFALHSNIGTRFPLRNVLSESPVLFNGSFVFGPDVVYVDQMLTGADPRSQTVGAKFALQSYEYLPEDLSEVMMNVTTVAASQVLHFTVILNGIEYTLQITPSARNPRLVLINLLREGNLRGESTSLLQRYFAEGDMRRIHVENEEVDIRVKRIYLGDDPSNERFYHADISVRRH